MRPIALITGASSGIGAEFARRLGEDHDLVLVARSEDKLTALRDEIVERHGAGNHLVLIADLSLPDGPQAVIDRITAGGVRVDLLINNAGAGYHGDFAAEPAALMASQIQLNCVSTVILTRAVLPGMLERGRGQIVNVASTAAFQPVPSMAVYGATKAFVLSFSEALHVEMSRTGVEVLALCPGSTDTGFFAAATSEFLTRGRQRPAEVVATALKALRRHRSVVVSGPLNKITAKGYRVLPRALIAWGSGYRVRSDH